MSKARTKTRSRPVNKGRGRSTARERLRAARAEEQRRAVRRRRAGFIGAAVLALVVVGALFLIYQGGQGRSESAGGGSGYKHVEGDPGAGETAPGFSLTSSTGATVNLDDFRGENVLLYFQEGLMCQACWDQITDLEANQDAWKAAGIDTIVSISHDAVPQLERKVTDEGISSTIVLSDPTQEVIRAYDAHKYGMMRGQTAGHTFILVGPDGTIQWRADYGGPPDYTMFVPTDDLLADLATERVQ